MNLSVADVLDFLVAKSMAPSTLGSQLDRLRLGFSVEPDPFRAREEVENHLLQQAFLIRCIDAFRAREEFDISTSIRKRQVSEYKTLEKLQRHTHPTRPQGEIALGILRAYHERSTQSQERGLLEVYHYLSIIAPSCTPNPPKDVADMLQAFREGTAKRARNISCESYADSLLALQRFVRVWNKKND